MQERQQEYVIETQCGFFCEPIELKIVEGKNVYHGYVDAPRELATAYSSRGAAVAAIIKFEIQKSVAGIIPVRAERRSHSGLSPANQDCRVLPWEKSS